MTDFQAAFLVCNRELVVSCRQIVRGIRIAGEGSKPGNPEGRSGAAPVRKVTMEDAQAFIRLRIDASVKMAAAVAACVISPIPLILLGGAAEYGAGEGAKAAWLTENMAGGAGLTLLLLLVACAVAVFIVYGTKMKKYEYLEKEDFELSYGIEGMVRERYDAKEHSFTVRTAVGVVLCIVGVIPLLIAAVMECSPMTILGTVALLLGLVAAAVFLFVMTGMEKGAYEQLLQMGDYTPRGKEANQVTSQIAAVYWPVVTAVYVGYSLWSQAWNISWIIWPVAGILFGTIAGFVSLRQKSGD